MTRISEFFIDLENDGMSDGEIAAGLGNGDVDRPEWMVVSEADDHLKVWDTEDVNASAQMGSVRIDY